MDREKFIIIYSVTFVRVYQFRNPNTINIHTALVKTDDAYSTIHDPMTLE